MCFCACVLTISSIYSAETYAILLAHREISRLDLDDVIIFSDSRSVLSCLNTLGLKSDINPIFCNILGLLDELIIGGNKSIKFVWIPSHLGIVGNDKANELANKSLSSANIIVNKIFYKELYLLFNSSSLEDMKEYVANYDFIRGLKGRKYIEKNGPFSLVPWFDKFDLDRKRVIIINRIKSGHVRTRDHLFKKNILDSNLCDCNEAQTLNHLVWNCPNYALYRDSLCLLFNNKGVRNSEDITDFFNETTNEEGMETILRIIFFILISKIILILFIV